MAFQQKIICCGTVIGTVHEMKIFCREMWDYLKEDKIFGHEQGVMNYLVYENLLPIENLIEIDVQTGEIFTADLFNVLYGLKGLGDKILRGDDGIPAVVHQYDRNDQIVRLVDKTYRDKNFQFDGRFVDTLSTIEQSTALLRTDKIGKATQLFMKKYLANSDVSNFGNALIELRKVALTKSNSQTLELLELVVQDALKSVKGFSSRNALRQSEKINHPVDDDFKIFLQMLFG